MVPSRSRKTAGRSAEGSGRRHLRERRLQGEFDHRGPDGGHAAMIGGAAAKEAWAAIGLLLDDGDARSDRGGGIWVGRTGDGDHREGGGGGGGHGTGIGGGEEVGIGKGGGEIG